MTADSAPALVDGLLTGAVYALVAAGFTLIYDVLRLPNLAHGGLLTLAMGAGWVLAAKFGIDPYASLPLITLLLFAAGYGLHAGLIQPVARGRRGIAVLLTIGMALTLEALVLVAAGTVPRTMHLIHLVSTVAAGPVPMDGRRLPGAVIAALVGGVLYVFMTRTDTGRSIRAVAREPVAACLVGIRPARMRALAYGVGCACLGAAGCLLLPGGTIGPLTGPLYLLVGAAGAVVGGLGSLPGALAGGLLVGIAEALGVMLLGQNGGALAIGGVLLLALLLRSPSLWVGRGRRANA